jgi:2-polyprenyl-3-methyl-5-hydroxy-6-metoxy-1,4-benzoquinol methylase
MTYPAERIQHNEVFYKRLFKEDPYWSTPYPNSDEAARWAKICMCLSRIPQSHRQPASQPLRILDVGCGRGWLTALASVYGQAEGVDPVADSIETARGYYPELAFFCGTARDVGQSAAFAPYDVVIASEVIEHVEDKQKFIDELVECLVPNGYAIITSPRGEYFHKWLHLGIKPQPVEAWVSEKKLSQMFKSKGFVPISHDRVYLDLPRMSLRHRICSSRRLADWLGYVGLIWILKGLQFAAGFYQVWSFQLNKERSSSP